jgi:hypothetical protein
MFGGRRIEWSASRQAQFTMISENGSLYLPPPSFSQLDQRIHTLEINISTLKTRMDRLETSRA